MSKKAPKFAKHTNNEMFVGLQTKYADDIGVSSLFSDSAKVGAFGCISVPFVPLQNSSAKAIPSVQSAPEKTEAGGLLTAELLYDLKHLPKTQLYKKYKHEYNCWRAMLARRFGNAKALVAKRWLDFPRYLRDMGKCPAAGWTVDRINPSNRKYCPGLVRWASVKTQNYNKTCTLTVKHPVTGELWTAAQIAELHHPITTKTARLWIKEGRSVEFLLKLGSQSHIDIAPAPMYLPMFAPLPGRWDEYGEPVDDAAWNFQNVATEVYINQREESPPYPRLKSLPLSLDQIGSSHDFDEEWHMIKLQPSPKQTLAVESTSPQPNDSDYELLRRYHKGELSEEDLWEKLSDEGLNAFVHEQRKDAEAEEQQIEGDNNFAATEFSTSAPYAHELNEDDHEEPQYGECDDAGCADSF